MSPSFCQSRGRKINFNSQFLPQPPSNPPPHCLKRVTRFSLKLSTIFNVKFRFWSASFKALTLTKSPAVYPMSKSESNQLYSTLDAIVTGRYEYNSFSIMPTYIGVIPGLDIVCNAWVRLFRPSTCHRGISHLRASTLLS